MSKAVIGFITNTRFEDDEDNRFLRIAKKVGVELVVINSAKEIDINKIEEKAKRCDLILNDQTDYISLEIAKSLELLGCKVVEFSKSFYYTEDKWMLYLKCIKNNIPVPKTILLPSDLVSAGRELKEFNQWPVVLKRIEGFFGSFVDKADNVEEAIEVIQRFWKKGDDRFPIIAQEFIRSQSYRVTTIGGKVVQTALKKNKDWKATGATVRRCYKFEVDEELQKIVDKLVKIIDIDICGMDFAKNGDSWVLIEVNAEPGLDFFACEFDTIIEKILKHLKEKALAGK